MIRKLETNQVIRNALQKTGMKKWELADLMNIHCSTLSVKLRHELPEDEQIRIVKLIEDHNTKGAENND